MWEEPSQPHPDSDRHILLITRAGGQLVLSASATFPYNTPQLPTPSVSLQCSHTSLSRTRTATEPCSGCGQFQFPSAAQRPGYAPCFPRVLPSSLLPEWQLSVFVHSPRLQPRAEERKENEQQSRPSRSHLFLNQCGSKLVGFYVCTLIFIYAHKRL